MDKIIVPVDGSESAGRAARLGAELARATGARLILLYVYDAPTVAQMGLRSLSKDEMEHAKQGVSKGSFDEARKAIGGVDVPIDLAIEVGHPALEITTHARASKADLIVIGSRGLSPLQGMMLGSVSERVVRTAPCPVTVVH